MIPHNSCSLHTCWGQSSGRAPRSTAEAKTVHSRTSSGSGTRVTGRPLRSRSWRIRTPRGKTGEGPNRCFRWLRIVFLRAAGGECSAQPRADQPGHQTAAAWGWWVGCRCGCGGWRRQGGIRGIVPSHTTAKRQGKMSEDLRDYEKFNLLYYFFSLYCGGPQGCVLSPMPMLFNLSTRNIACS